jgi:hypothetical protein
MKNLYKLIGIIALVAGIGFSFTACGDDDDDNGGGGGTFTLTGIPSEYNGKYIQIWIDKTGGWTRTDVWGSQDKDGSQTDFVLISNGRASIPLWTGTSIDRIRYTLTETVSCSGGIGNTKGGYLSLVSFRILNIPFTNGSATKSWADITTSW